MSDSISLVELSSLVRILGLSYLAGFVISTSGLFPGFGKPLTSKHSFSEATTRIHKKKFGWGAEQYPGEEVTTKDMVRWLPLTLILIALCLFGMRWVENAQMPILNFALGLALIALGLYLRRQFIRDWDGSPRKLDFACFLIGFLFFFQQVS